MQAEAGAAPAARTDEPMPAEAARRPVAEPTTAVALWPTFMRRTLAEELLRGKPAARC